MVHNDTVYYDSYDTARGCLIGLALLADPSGGWRYWSLLLHLDSINGWPDTVDHALHGHRWELLAHLEIAIDDMINSGGRRQPLESILRAAMNAEG